MIQINSTKNPLIKQIKSLYRKKERRDKGLFIVEGIKIIEEIIDKGYPFRNIVYTDSLLKNSDGREMFSKIDNIKNLIHVPENVFKEISDTESPQGILAVVNIEINKIDDLNINQTKILLYLDRVQDPGNMGTIIRTADAFDVDGIIISEGCVDPYNPKVARATMGSIFRVPLYFVDNGIFEIKKLKSKGINIYSSSLIASVDIDKVDFKKNAVVVIGNESSGVSSEIYDLSDKLIKIPMLGDSESLNAGVAASIIMYEAMTQNN